MTPRTFAQTLTRALLKAAFVFAVVAVFAVPSALLRHPSLRVAPSLSASDDSVAGVLVEQHHCWRMGDEHPKVDPTHAVVELDSRRGPEVVTAKVGYGIWLEGDAGTLYAFCR